MNTYIIKTIKANKGYCKQCKIAFNKYEDVELLKCNTHFDIISEIDPHVVGLFHYKCYLEYLKENNITPQQIKF